MADCLRYPLALQPAHLLLLLAEDRTLRYELMTRLRDLGAPTVIRGSVYRELGKLREEGLVTSFWEVRRDGVPRGGCMSSPPPAAEAASAP